MVICEQQYVDRVRASGVPIEHIVCVDGAPPARLPTDFQGRPATSSTSSRRRRNREDIVTPYLHVRHNGNPKVWRCTHATCCSRGGHRRGARNWFGDQVILPATAHIADRATGLYLQGDVRHPGQAGGRRAHDVAALLGVRPTVGAVSGLKSFQGRNRISPSLVRPTR